MGCEGWASPSAAACFVYCDRKQSDPNGASERRHRQKQNARLSGVDLRGRRVQAVGGNQEAGGPGGRGGEYRTERSSGGRAAVAMGVKPSRGGSKRAGEGLNGS
jgi:hypothetical protein